jgi:hypothetical protein
LLEGESGIVDVEVRWSRAGEIQHCDDRASFMTPRSFAATMRAVPAIGILSVALIVVVPLSSF